MPTIDLDAADLAAADRREIGVVAQVRHVDARCLRRLHDNPPWLYLFHPVEAVASRPGAARVALDHRGVLSFGA